MSDPAEAAGLEVLAGLAGLEAGVFAARARVLHDLALLSDRLHGVDGVERFLVLDVAGTLRVGQIAAGRRLAEARRLVAVLPRTLAGLDSGAVLVVQALAVLDETDGCGDEVAAEVDRRLYEGLGEAGLAGWSGRRLRGRLKRLALTVEAELDPAAARERQAAARRARRISVRSEPDGMASLWALLPAEQLRTFTLGLDELVRRQQRLDDAAGFVRTADQRRADVFVLMSTLALHGSDAVSGGAPAGGGGCSGLCRHPAVMLNVHVPMATLLDLSQAPGLLEGYGPISAEHVRMLLPGTQLRTVLVDEETGEPLALHDPQPATGARQRPGGRSRRGGRRAAATDGPEDSRDHLEKRVAGSAAGDQVPEPVPEPWPPGAVQHRTDRERVLALLPNAPVLIDDAPEPQHDPSVGLARLVRLRDPLCTGPGCAMSSTRCDLDHERSWPAGPTTAGNLRPRSRRCHRAKTLSWQVQRTRDGCSYWTSPTGRTYIVPPAWDPPPPADAQPGFHIPLHGPPGSDGLDAVEIDSGMELTAQLDRAIRRGLRPSPPASTGWSDDPGF